MLNDKPEAEAPSIFKNTAQIDEITSTPPAKALSKQMERRSTMKSDNWWIAGSIMTVITTLVIAYYMAAWTHQFAMH